MRRRHAASEYERTWGKILAAIEAEIATGSRDPCQVVSSVWEGISAHMLGDRRFRHYYARAGLTPGQRLAVRNGVYTAVPFRPFRDLSMVTVLIEALQASAEPFDTVVELGSGFGRNLFDLSVASAGRLGAQIPLHACELTQAGRESTARLRDLSGRIDLSVHPFDYYKPDLSFLGRGERRVLFFTAHSIEQITQFDAAVIEEMIARTVRCTVVHFEPVGWQHDARLVAWRQAHDGWRGRLQALGERSTRSLKKRIDRAFGSGFDHGFPGIHLESSDRDSPRRVSANAAAWSATRGYNRNLVSLLRAFQSEGAIAIEAEDLNAFGNSPFNPTTVIRWSSR